MKVDWRGPEGSSGGLMGVWRGSEVLEVDWRGSTGVYWGSGGGLRSWKDYSGCEGTRGVCWGSEVLEVDWRGLQGSIEGLLGLRGPGRIKVDLRASEGSAGILLGV